MWRRIGIAIIGAATLLGSCRRVDRTVFASFVDIGETGWDPVNVIGFNPWPLDSVSTPSDRYGLSVIVRFDPATAPSGLPLFVRLEDENGEIATDTLRIVLKDDDGHPRGRKSLVLSEVAHEIRRDLSLTDGFSVELTTLLPADMTRGITNIGVKMTEER